MERDVITIHGLAVYLPHLFVVGVAGVVAVAAADRGYGQNGVGQRVASIVQDQRTQNAYGEYNFQYETSDGILRQEAGKQKDGQVTQGGYRYTSPEGIPVEITFVADHGGFQPSGSMLPVAPPLPYKRVQNFVH